MNKDRLRQQLKTRRDQLSAADCAAAASKLIKFFPQDWLQDGDCIAAYWPVGKEIDPVPLLKNLPYKNLQLIWPLGKDPHHPAFYQASLADMPTTPGHATALVPALMLLPLLGFDAAGNRLGQGGGWYDRYLSRYGRSARPKVIGLAFSCQQWPSLPHEPHDQPMDAVITETQLFIC